MQRWGDVCIMNGRIRDCRIPDPFAQNLNPSSFHFPFGTRNAQARLGLTTVAYAHPITGDTPNTLQRHSAILSYGASTCSHHHNNTSVSPQIYFSFNSTRLTNSLLLIFSYYFARRLQQSYTVTHSITGRSECKHPARLDSIDNSHLVPASHLGVSSHHSYHIIASN